MRSPRSSHLWALVFATAAFLSRSAPAADDVTEAAIADKRAELEVVKKKGHALCPTQVDSRIKEYIFAFDGAGGFSGYDYLFNFNDPSTGKAGYDFFHTRDADFPNGTAGIYDEKGNYQARPESWSENRFLLYRSAMAMRSKYEGNAALIDAIDDASESLSAVVPKRVLYYAWNSSGIAANCAAKVRKMYAKAGRPVAISAIGFSLGGYATVLFNRMLDWRGIHVKNVLTLDAVPFTHEVFRALLNRKNNTVISVPANHDAWTNLFQRKDDGVLNTIFGVFPIHGVKMAGNVKNRIPLRSDGEQVSGHMQVPASDVAVAEMVKILTN